VPYTRATFDGAADLEVSSTSTNWLLERVDLVFGTHTTPLSRLLSASILWQLITASFRGGLLAYELQ
jgi:hypothetical protein